MLYNLLADDLAVDRNGLHGKHHWWWISVKSKIIVQIVAEKAQVRHSFRKGVPSCISAKSSEI